MINLCYAFFTRGENGPLRPQEGEALAHVNTVLGCTGSGNMACAGRSTVDTAVAQSRLVLFLGLGLGGWSLNPLLWRWPSSAHCDSNGTHGGGMGPPEPSSRDSSLGGADTTPALEPNDQW